MMGGNLMADAAKALNISTSTLQADMKAGDSLATIAANNGSSATALEATLLADAKAQIQSSVSSGKITSTQATTIEAHLSTMIDNFVTMKPGSMKAGKGGMGALMGTLQSDVAKALNISTSTLQADMKAGDSLATIAANNGSSATALESALTTDATNEINSLVSSGKITSTQATSIEANLSKMIDAYVTNKPGSMPQGGGGMLGSFMKDVTSDVATALNISTTTVQTDMKSGESLATIAANNGSSATALESALTTDATNEINSLVSSGKLTSTQATSLEANLSKMIDGFVTRTPGKMTNGGFHGWSGGWGTKAKGQSSSTGSSAS